MTVNWREQAGLEHRTLTFPSQVQNVPVSRMVFCSTTRTIPATDSATFMIPSTSHPRDTFAMSLFEVSQSLDGYGSWEVLTLQLRLDV